MSKSFRPVTLRSEQREGDVLERRVTVVDTPGLCSSQLSEEQVRAELEEALQLSAPGPHAFLLTHQLGRFTQQEQEGMETLEKMLCPAVRRYSTVLFTYGDRLGDTDIDRFIREDENLQKLLQKCGGRYHVFNNKETGNTDQVRELHDKKFSREGKHQYYVRSSSQSKESALNQMCQTMCYVLLRVFSSRRGLLLVAGAALALGSIYYLIWWRLVIGRETNGAYFKRGVCPMPALSFFFLALNQTDVQCCSEPRSVLSTDLRLVLVGQERVGKSAAGNTILGKKEFASSLSFRPVTLSSEKREGDVLERRVTVVDTPGLCSSQLSEEQVRAELEEALQLSAPGPHAFLLTHQLGRFTQQEQKGMETLEKMLCPAVRRYTTVLFTYGDRLGDTDIERFIREDENLQKLLQKCGGRYHVFNNKETGNTDQVRELLDKIEFSREENTHIMLEALPSQRSLH
ncbi:GTPase IMAP family member 8-like [Centroberyx affinis]|uniref:GTPase IMAP family member 8-like n=1 Tax=Centroberyx affinis TaxID=166261 RepID=UPI003A5BBDA4